MRLGDYFMVKIVYISCGVHDDKKFQTWGKEQILSPAIGGRFGVFKSEYSASKKCQLELKTSPNTT